MEICRRLISKTYLHLWRDFFKLFESCGTMRKFNVFLSILILVSNLIISYNHSVELFILGGFKGWMANLGVIAIELTFLQGAVNILTARYKRKEVGSPAIMAGLIGVLLVGLSNVRAGWSYGWIGVVLGVAVPVGMLISEAMLTRSFLYNQKDEYKEVTPIDSPELGVSIEINDWLESYYEEHKRIPSRSLVMEKLEISEWSARKVVEDFKKNRTLTQLGGSECPNPKNNPS